MKKLFLGSFFAAVLITLSLYLIPYLKIEKGEVFSPVNSQHFSCGDCRFYYTGVLKAVNNFFEFETSTNSIGVGTQIDKSRISLYRMAAALTFFVREKRLGYVLTSFLALLFTIYFLAYFFHLYGAKVLMSLFLAVIFIFYLDVFRGFLLFDFSLMKDQFAELVLGAGDSFFPQRFNDNFRFLVLSHANIFIIGAFAINVFLTRRRSPIFLWSFVLPFTFFLLYTYLPVVIYAGVLIFGGLVQGAKLRKSYFDLYLFAFIFLVVGFMSGVFFDLWHIYSQVPAAIADAHLHQAKLFSFENITNQTDIFKAFAFMLVLSILAYRFKFSSKSILFWMSVILFLQCFAVFEGHGIVLNRFFIRGGLSFAFIAAILFMIDCLNLLKNKNAFAFLNRPLQIGLFVICVMPVITSFKVSEAMATAKSYSLDRSAFESYDWLAAQSKSSDEILALTVSDIQLLPNFMPANLTIAGAEYLRDPADELKRYIYFTRVLGIKNNLKESLENYLPLRPEFYCSPKKRFGDFKKFESMHFFDQMLYYPFISKVSGISIVENGKINPEFLDYIEKISNDVSLSYPLPRFILLNREQKLDLNAEFISRNYTLVFENLKQVIYQKNRAR